MELKIIPVVQVLLAALFMIIINYFTPSLTFSFGLKMFIVELLIVIAIVCGALAITSFRQHQTTINPILPENTRKVVDTGIYARSRNPMYLAMLLALMALAFYLANLVAILILPLFLIYITRFQIIPEERALLKLFGDDYKNYTKKVRRWL